MSDAASLAEKCMDEGCPIDMVSDLIAEVWAAPASRPRLRSSSRADALSRPPRLSRAREPPRLTPSSLPLHDPSLSPRAQLKAESNELSKRQQTLLVAIDRLQALNASPEANKNEIEKIVSAASRSFSVVEGYDFPGEALGYSLKPSYGNKLE